MSDPAPIDPGTGMGISIFYIVFLIIYIIGVWKIYVKAGEAGWKSLIPFYNIYVLLKIVGRPGWWLLLYFIPFVNIFIMLIVAMDLAKSFNKSIVFGVLALWLFSFIGYLILGFDKSSYVGPAAGGSSKPAANPQTPA